jgi:hypothetical protein
LPITALTPGLLIEPAAHRAILPNSEEVHDPDRFSVEADTRMGDSVAILGHWPVFARQTRF